uniref:hypothetical protein n=1 Tax=Brachyspira sp. TaxID=1977261 RepID=UPI002601A9AE
MPFDYYKKLSELKEYNLQSLINLALSCLPKKYQEKPWNNPNLYRGTTIYQDEEQLNLYLAAYGIMHQKKLLLLYEQISKKVLLKPFYIFDWGCGQGIATLALIEFMKEKNIPLENIKEIVLIEPSKIAIKRAEKHIKLFSSSCRTKSFIKTFNEIYPYCTNLGYNNDFPIIHLFSNVLDIPDYNIKKFASAITSICYKSYWVITSPYYSQAIAQIDILLHEINNKKILFEYQKRSKSNKENDFTCYSKLVEVSTKWKKIKTDDDIKYIKDILFINIVRKFNNIVHQLDKIDNNNTYFRNPFLHGFSTDLFIINPTIGGIAINFSFAKNKEDFRVDIVKMNNFKKHLFETNTILFNNTLKSSKEYNT